MIAISSIKKYRKKIKNATYRSIENYKKNKYFTRWLKPKNYIELDVGFYFFCVNQPRATFETLKSVRTYFSEAPIYLIGDGFDFSEMAKRFNCYHIFKPRHIGSFWKKPEDIFEYLERIQEACLKCRKEWMILLHPDVLVHDKISKYPDAHIAGVSAGDRTRSGISNNQFSEAANQFILKKFPNAELNGYGAAGGSIFHTASFLQCMDKRHEFDLEFIKGLDPKITQNEDMLLPYLFMFNGFTYRIWLDISEKLRGQSGLGDAAAFEHQVRDYYDMDSYNNYVNKGIV